MNINIVNLTPHAINLRGEEISSSGVARCESHSMKVDEVNGIPVNHRLFGEVTGLPEPKKGTVYIVSAIVAQALSGERNDIFIVDETIRDENGRIIGCNALARI